MSQKSNDMFTELSLNCYWFSDIQRRCFGRNTSNTLWDLDWGVLISSNVFPQAPPITKPRSLISWIRCNLAFLHDRSQVFRRPITGNPLNFTRQKLSKRAKKSSDYFQINSSNPFRFLNGPLLTGESSGAAQLHAIFEIVFGLLVLAAPPKASAWSRTETPVDFDCAARNLVDSTFQVFQIPSCTPQVFQVWRKAPP